MNFFKTLGEIMPIFIARKYLIEHAIIQSDKKTIGWQTPITDMSSGFTNPV